MSMEDMDICCKRYPSFLADWSGHGGHGAGGGVHQPETGVDRCHIPVSDLGIYDRNMIYLLYT